MAKPELYIGLISGTSMDGIDAALVEFKDDRPRLIASYAHDLDDELREKLLELSRGDDISLRDLGRTHIAIGDSFADAAAALLAKADLKPEAIAGLGSHGQTVWHEPEGERPFTLQLGDPNTIAQRSGISTVADLRGRDIAAGGEGAPLAPLLHRDVFHSPDADRVILNIGGMANITVLPRSGACRAFDTGPGNVLMDYWIGKHRQERFDRDGAWACGGQFKLSLLNALLQEDYFSQPIPKSTGRELFNGRWLESKIEALGMEFEAQDVQATLLTLTVTTIVSDLGRYSTPQEMYVCGGGVHNKALMAELSKVAGDFSVDSTAKLGVDPDWVEAMAFAWIARETLAGRAVDTGAFTGASRPVMLGGVYQKG